MRETWNYLNAEKINGKYQVCYKATDEHKVTGSAEGTHAKWRPSIHMQRWASRIQLEITDIKVERVQDITEEGAKAEGTKLLSHDGKTIYTKDHKSAFKILWDSINLKRGYGWDKNCWVWVVKFKVVK